MDRITKVRKLYEQEYLNFRLPNGYNELMTDFKSEFKIAEDSFSIDEDACLNFSEHEALLFEQQISKRESPCNLSRNINQKIDVPNNLLQACDRIYWYLKPNYGELAVIKISVDNIDTFAICIQGYAGDGFDNSCELIEIWDSSGNLIGSATPPYGDDLKNGIWNWKNRPIESNDFNYPAPEW